jgi:hypothetical protein
MSEKKDNIQGNWDIVVAKTLDQAEAMRKVWQEMQNSQASAAPNADLDRYRSVLESEEREIQPHVILIRSDGHPVAIVIGRIEKHELACRVGYKTIYKPSIRCLTVVYGGILGELDNTVSAMIVRELLSTLRRNEADMIYLSHIRVDSPVYNLARKMPGFVCRGHFPIIQNHWTMSVPENIEVFFQRCSKKHRGNLKRCVRKLEDEYPGQVKLISYHRDNEVEDAVRAASEISSKTYQHTLGKGLKGDPRTLLLLRSAARHGWLQADILFVRDRPCAFQFGLKYQGAYHLDQIGFDPAWNQFNVGTILFLKVLENLCNDPKVDTIDFGFGDAGYKQWYGDNCWQEALLYIFAPRLYPICVNMVQSIATSLYLGANYLARKVGFMGRAKRLWRNYLQQKNK